MATTGSTLFNAFFDQITGVASVDYGALIAGYGAAAGIVFGNNPKYNIADFLLYHSKFFGTPTAFTATANSQSNTITLTDATGVSSGQLITGAGIPDATLITSVSGTTITISSLTSAALGFQSVNIYTAPKMPVIIIQMYINLAQASLMAARYGSSMWVVAMGLFIAHYCTLYLKSDNSPAGATAGMIAAQGMAGGIQVSKSVGDVSTSYQPLQCLADWGSFNLTLYGIQFASMAMVVGSGPIGVR